MTNYEPVSVRAEKRGTCAVCGKSARRSQTFSNTVNPWNRNPDGTPRTKAEIMTRLLGMAKAWQSEPVAHAGCEDAR